MRVAVMTIHAVRRLEVCERSRWHGHADGIRDGEHGRAWMQGRFREELAGRRVPWVEVRGTRDERLAAATAAVDEVVAEGWDLADPVG